MHKVFSLLCGVGCYGHCIFTVCCWWAFRSFSGFFFPIKNCAQPKWNRDQIYPPAWKKQRTQNRSDIQSNGFQDAGHQSTKGSHCSEMNQIPREPQVSTWGAAGWGARWVVCEARWKPAAHPHPRLRVEDVELRVWRDHHIWIAQDMVPERWEMGREKLGSLQGAPQVFIRDQRCRNNFLQELEGSTPDAQAGTESSCLPQPDSTVSQITALGQGLALEVLPH